MGSGIYVCPPVQRELRHDLSGEEGPLELLRAREMIEGEVAYAAVQHGSRQQIAAIEEAYALMIAIPRRASIRWKPTASSTSAWPKPPATACWSDW
jgi:DNA-binding FadR family transcriptional regulator